MYDDVLNNNVQISCYNNYKNNIKDNTPDWLHKEVKAEPWDLSNPEELKQYQELEEIFREFRGDSNE